MTTQVRIPNQQQQNLKDISVVRERCQNPLIKVQSLAYIVIKRPDIENAAKFFVDYGLVVDSRNEGKIFLRGKSQTSHCILLERGEAEIERIGLIASEQDVAKLAATYRVPIQTHEAPMGGQFVAIQDPSKRTLEINCNLNTLPPLPPVKRDVSEWNTWEDKNRINETVRNLIQPVTISKLGHTVWSVNSIKKSVHWYQEVLGFIVSDFQFLKDDPVPVIAFMRCDRGDEPCDHHTIGIGSAIELGHLHSAFEMDSYEDIAIANQWMRDKKYKHGWGIGRHVLGSQVFDYWRDPFGEMFEHYADGDLFDAEAKTGYHLFHAGAQHQWGPDMTDEFKGVTQPGKMLKFILKRLPTKDDLTLSRLIRMIKVA